jgi:hypothetical protein
VEEAIQAAFAEKVRMEKKKIVEESRGKRYLHKAEWTAWNGLADCK